MRSGDRQHKRCMFTRRERERELREQARRFSSLTYTTTTTTSARSYTVSLPIILSGFRQMTDTDAVDMVDTNQMTK